MQKEGEGKGASQAARKTDRRQLSVIDTVRVDQFVTAAAGPSLDFII